MLRIPAYIAHSSIHGMGVFAQEPIQKGTLIWSFEEKFDQRFNETEYEALPQKVKDFMKWYGYKYTRDGFYYLPGDHDRFVNHADDANTYDAEDGNVYARRDIAKGEELTLNYKEFDTDWIARQLSSGIDIAPLTKHVISKHVAQDEMQNRRSQKI